MAAALGLRLSRFARQYYPFGLLRTNPLKFSSELCFHKSAFLFVKGQAIKMPSLSPTMSEGTIVKWLKKEGDQVSPGDVLCEIQTDKAVMSFETEEEGVLAKILIPDDTKDVKVGTLIALLVEEGEDWKSVEIPGDLGNQLSSSSSSSSEDVSASTEGKVEGQEVKMPSLSPTMTAGTIVKWLKKEGEKISPGDVLCEIQTDKAVMSFETEEEGILAKILVPDDSKDVKVGTLIAILVEEGSDWKNVAIPSTSTTSTKPASSVKSEDKPKQKTSVKSIEIKNYGPAVHRLKEEYGIELKQVTATGNRGKLLKADVLQFIEQKKLQKQTLKSVPPPQLPSKSLTKDLPKSKIGSLPTPMRKRGEKYIDKEISSMRRTIAKRLSESKTQIPHAYSTIQCNIDSITSARSKLKAEGIAISLNDFLIKAVALSLRQCPQVNALYSNDRLVLSQDIDISIAVATDAGLITPIIKAADTKNVSEISLIVKDLATRARNNKLQLHEFQGGSFTISNLGMFGIKEFTAIINPPQCGILAVGGGEVILDKNLKGNTMMNICLSFNRQAIDDDTAAEFLEVVKNFIENPSLMLIDKSISKAAMKS